MGLEEMQEVAMMMTLTDVASWPGYNEMIDISPKKVRAGRTGLGERYMQKLFGILNYNEIITGGRESGDFFWFFVWRVCGVSQKTQRTYSVLANVESLCSNFWIGWGRGERERGRGKEK